MDINLIEEKTHFENVKIGDLFIHKDGSVYFLVCMDSKLILLNSITNTIYLTYDTTLELEEGGMENNYLTHYSQDKYELNLVRKK